MGCSAGHASGADAAGAAHGFCAHYFTHITGCCPPFIIFPATPSEGLAAYPCVALQPSKSQFPSHHLTNSLHHPTPIARRWVVSLICLEPSRHVTSFCLQARDVSCDQAMSLCVAFSKPPQPTFCACRWGTWLGQRLCLRPHWLSHGRQGRLRGGAVQLGASGTLAWGSCDWLEIGWKSCVWVKETYCNNKPRSRL